MHQVLITRVKSWIGAELSATSLQWLCSRGPFREGIQSVVRDHPDMPVNHETRWESGTRDAWACSPEAQGMDKCLPLSSCSETYFHC